MVIAGLTGLDIFAVVLGTSSDQSQYFSQVGIAITGVLMGLGASPTHEAIRLLQEMKKLRKAQNTG